MTGSLYACMIRAQSHTTCTTRYGVRKLCEAVPTHYKQYDQSRITEVCVVDGEPVPGNGLYWAAVVQALAVVNRSPLRSTARNSDSGKITIEKTGTTKHHSDY